MDSLELTQKLIRDCLQLKASETLTRDTPLLGGFPEFNSLTVATLIVEIENNVDCEIDDGEVTAETFESVGSLANFVETKMAAA